MNTGAQGFVRHAGGALHSHGAERGPVDGRSGIEGHVAGAAQGVAGLAAGLFKGAEARALRNRDSPGIRDGYFLVFPFPCQETRRFPQISQILTSDASRCAFPASDPVPGRTR
jgi:hypothetical protein